MRNGFFVAQRLANHLFTHGWHGFDPGGAALVKLEGFPRWTNWIEVSSDLVHWNPWTNYFNVSGSMEIVDPGASTNSRRFYRSTIRQ
jgi:hypothetical protein